MPPFDSIVPPPLQPLYTQRGYSPGVRAGGLLFISGMLGRRADVSVVEAHEAQLVRMFENMGQVLAAAGCGWDDLVEITGFFTDLQRDYDLFIAVRNRFVREPWPAMTMIGCAQLAQPGLICELKGIAVVPGAA